MMSDTSAIDFAKRYQLTHFFAETESKSAELPNDAVDLNLTTPYSPVWSDLARLFALIRLRKATTVLEFGCGFSTVIMAHALSLNEKRDGVFVRNELRRGNPYELHVVDDMQRYLDLTRDRLPAELIPRVSFHQSLVRMTTFNSRICTEYDVLPNICPDLIYLDGPHQSVAAGDINGISTRHPDRLPMACDILKIEHFLLPGTLVLVDGRTANARFLKSNLQREWRHEHDEAGDVHYFEMIEEPLGKWNRRQIEFCLGADWRSKPLRPNLQAL